MPQNLKNLISVRFELRLFDNCSIFSITTLRKHLVCNTCGAKTLFYLPTPPTLGALVFGPPFFIIFKHDFGTPFEIQFGPKWHPESAK